MSSVPHMQLYFDDFLKKIRLNEEEKESLIDAHTKLRSLLLDDDILKTRIINTFLQGSYRRSTIIKPAANQRSDVDVVVVTNLSEDDYAPDEALNLFMDFLNRNYPNKYIRQGRSWGIKLDDADIDLVPTSAPSEALAESEFLKSSDIASLDIENLYSKDSQKKSFSLGLGADYHFASSSDDWKNETLRIPNREAGAWEDTDPISQINWTTEKNQQSSGYYVNVVKALKWWWRVMHSDKKYPKGYPLEHLIGDCCPNEISSIADGVVNTFENIVLLGPLKPVLNDRGISNDVMKRISQEDYRIFFEAASEAAELARAAFNADNDYDASIEWRKIFGDEFPIAPKPGDKTNFSERTTAGTLLSEARFA